GGPGRRGDGRRRGHGRGHDHGRRAGGGGVDLRPARPARHPEVGGGAVGRGGEPGLRDRHRAHADRRPASPPAEGGASGAGVGGGGAWYGARDTTASRVAGRGVLMAMRGSGSRTKDRETRPVTTGQGGGGTMGDGLVFRLDEEETQLQAKIRVIGLGGGGSNAINRMIASRFTGVTSAVANTYVQAMRRTPAPIKIQLGATLTGGLGAGTDP